MGNYLTPPKKGLTTLYQNTPDLSPDATVSNQGVVGVVGEKIGRAAAGLGDLASDIHEGATTLASGAMEGTGKLLFGKDNKPFMGDDAPAPSNKPNQQVPPVLMDLPKSPTLVPSEISAKLTQPTPAAKGLTPLSPNATTDTTKNSNANAVGIPAATGVDGVSRTTDSQGKVTYSDAPAIAKRPLELKPLSNQVGINGAVAQPQTQQPTKLPEEQVRQLYRELPADAVSAAGMGGTTPQQRYAAQQQATMPDDDSIFSRPLRAAPMAQQVGDPELQQKIANAQSIIDGESHSGGNLTLAKQARLQLNDLMGKDTANSGLQLKQIEQAQNTAQEQGRQNQAANNEGWNRLMQSKQFDYGMQKDQQQVADSRSNAQNAGVLKLAELENTRQQNATENALKLKQLDQNANVVHSYDDIENGMPVKRIAVVDRRTGKVISKGIGQTTEGAA